MANGSVFCVDLKSKRYCSASSTAAMVVENANDVCSSKEPGIAIEIVFFIDADRLRLVGPYET